MWLAEWMEWLRGRRDAVNKQEHHQHKHTQCIPFSDRNYTVK